MDLTKNSYTLADIDTIIKSTRAFLEEKANEVEELTQLALSIVNSCKQFGLIDESLEKIAKTKQELQSSNDKAVTQFIVESKQEEITPKSSIDDRIAAVKAKQEELNIIHDVAVGDSVGELDQKLNPSTVWKGVATTFKLSKGKNIPKSLKELDSKFPEKIKEYLETTYKVDMKYFKEEIVGNKEFVVDNIVISSPYIE